MASDGQVRLQAALLRQQAKLVEPGRDPRMNGSPDEVPQGGPAPLREGRAQALGGLGGPARRASVLPAAASRSNRRRSSASGPTRMT